MNSPAMQMHGAAKAPEASLRKNPGKSIQASPYKWAEAGTEDSCCTNFHTVSKLDFNVNKKGVL